MDTPSSLDRTFRTTTLIAFFPALALLIPYGVVSCNVIPALGLIPAFFSAILGLPTSYLQRAQLTLYIDVFLAVSHISMLIPFWVLNAGWNSWESGGVIMLGTYGTVLLMMDL